jgi:DNA-binding MarR family transcriptional regulator
MTSRRHQTTPGARRLWTTSKALRVGWDARRTRDPEEPVTTLDDLTVRQRALLDALHRLHRTQGYAPSIRELGDAVGLTSTSSVHRHVRILEQRGLVERRERTPRTLRVREVSGQLPVS